MLTPAHKLNPEQAEAVAHGEGPLLIIAGAGTGKTTVVTERINHLVTTGLAEPSEILALTFTEKAAREMEERVDLALPYGYTQMWIGTFHGFCDRILRAEALHIGYTTSYKLMTQAEAVQLVRKHLFDFKLKYFRPLGNPNKFIDGMLTHFSRLQDEDISPEEYADWVARKKKKGGEISEELEKWEELAGAYKKYDDLKAAGSLVDFGDLIVKTIKLFRERPNVLSSYTKQFKYVLVDEFQDTNYAQNELAIMLAGVSANITVTGDDDQSIYRFRGAAVSNIIHFRKTYPKAKIVVLTKNYRSTQQILDYSYRLIQNNNPDRLEAVEGIDKHLVAQRKDEGEDVTFIHAKRVENEGEETARHIKKLVDENKYNYRDFAILVRANNHAEPFLRALARAGIPYQFLGPGRLFKQPEIIDLICYLKILYNFEDSVSFYRLISLPYFDVDARDLSALVNFARRNNICLFEASEEVSALMVSDETKRKVEKLMGILKRHMGRIRSDSAGQILYYFLNDTGLIQSLIKADDSEAEKRATNISKFFDKLKTYEVDHEDASVPTVVDWIELSSELGESPLAANSDWTDVDAVNILTVHSAKGLEFPVVFLVNLVSQRFPSTNRSDQLPIPDELIKEMLPQGDFHLQEERRLFYVGMTRARDKLLFTAADFYGEGKREKKLSPFIFEALGDDAIAAEQGEIKQLSLLDYSPPESPVHVSSPPFHVHYLSYSQIDTFRVCPLHYKLRYIIRIPTPSSGAQSMGSSVHAAMRQFYTEVKQGAKAEQKLIIAALEANWLKEGYTDKEHERESFAQSKSFLSEYMETEYASDQLPEVLEESFTIPLRDSKGNYLKIGGFIDRVDILPDGKIEIIDYKTGSNVPTQQDVDKNLQLTIYALAATQIRTKPFGKLPDEVLLSLYYFDGQKKLTTVRTKEELEAAVEELFAIKQEIEISDFKCSGSRLCASCDFKMYCHTDE